MRYGITAFIFLCALVSSICSAQAHGRHHYYRAAHHVGQAEIRDTQNFQPWAWSVFSAAPTETRGRRYHYDGSALSSPCRQAAHEGGPCGCWAAETLLGTSAHVYHGINVWLADGWRAFRHVAPAPGTAAIWPHHHVAPVIAVSSDGRTVTVRDSWATHDVRTAGLQFVDPRSR